jgi:hypothetical protein
VWTFGAGCVVAPELVNINRMLAAGPRTVTISADLGPSRADVLKFSRQGGLHENYVASPTTDAMINASTRVAGRAAPHGVVSRLEGPLPHARSVRSLSLKKAIIGYLGRYYHSVAGSRRTPTSDSPPRSALGATA